MSLNGVNSHLKIKSCTMKPLQTASYQDKTKLLV